MNNQSIKLETMTIASAGKLIQDQKISIEHLTQATLEQVHVTEPISMVLERTLVHKRQ